jgi:hypothetical protein
MDSGLLSSESIVELLTQQMTSLAHNQTTIIQSIWQKIHQTLKTSETRLLGVLVLVWPRFVRGNIRAIRKSEIGRVERDKQVLGTINLLEHLSDASFCPDIPHEFLVCQPVVHAHSFLVDDWEVLFCSSRKVVSVEAEAEVLEVGEHGRGVTVSTIFWDRAFDYGIAISCEVVAKVSI